MCSHLPWLGRHSRLELLEESLGLVALGRELKGQPPGSLCRVIAASYRSVPLSRALLSKWLLRSAAGRLSPTHPQKACRQRRFAGSSEISAAFPQTGAGKGRPWCSAWSFLHKLRPPTGSRAWWIADTPHRLPRASHGQGLTRACSRISQICL